jgi:hypothetical protein
LTGDFGGTGAGRSGMMVGGWTTDGGAAAAGGAGFFGSAGAAGALDSGGETAGFNGTG